MNPARGGDIIFTPGRGSLSGDLSPMPDGSFRFELANGTEVLRIDGDGTIKIRGNVVDDDESVYQAFRAWLASCLGAKGGGPT